MAIKIGEVIEAATGGFAAQCYELHNPPPFGALVRVSEGDIDIYAAVADATTTSIEPGRRPVARGGEEEGDVFSANPQLEKLLRTEIRAVVVGHKYSLPGETERLEQQTMEATLRAGRDAVAEVAAAFLARGEPVPFANHIHRFPPAS